MKLPATNAIGLPDDNAGVMVADATDPPVAWWDDDALRALLPGWARRGSLAVRDAVLRALARTAALLAAGSSRALNAQRTPRQAADGQLADQGAQLQIARAPGQSDAAYRASLMAGGAGISPVVLKRALQQMALAAAIPVYTQEPHRIGLFVCGATSTWQSFVSSAASRWWASDATADLVGGERAGAIILGSLALVPCLWVFVRASYDGDLLMVGSASLAPRDPTDYLVGSTATWSAFINAAAGARLVDAIAALLAANLAAGVAWRVYYDPNI